MRELYSEARFTPIDAANLLAGHAVSYATSFLDGRHSAAQLATNAERISLELLSTASQPEINRLLDPVRMLAGSMRLTARATLGDDDISERKERWQTVMASLVELVCHESRQLRTDEPLSDQDAARMRSTWDGEYRR